MGTATMGIVGTRARRRFLVLFLLFHVVVGAGLSPQVGTDAPGFALVIVDEAHGRYYPALDKYARLVPDPRAVTTVEQARQAGLLPDPQCVLAGAFCQWSSLLGRILDRTGLLRRPSRWNPDGTWNW